MKNGTIRLGNLVIDANTYEVRVGDRLVMLPHLQFKLLSCFAAHSNQIISSEQLIREVWGQRDVATNEKLRIQIYRLRLAIQTSAPWTIRTVPKRGYGLVKSASIRPSKRPAKARRHSPSLA